MIEVIKRSIVPAGREHAVTEWLQSEARGSEPDLWTPRAIEAHEFQEDEAEPAAVRVRARQHASGEFAIIYVAPWRAGAHPELALRQKSEARSQKAEVRPAPTSRPSRIFSPADAEAEWQRTHDA